MNDIDLARLTQRTVVPVVAVLLALLVGGILVSIAGVSPVDALFAVGQSAFSCSPQFCNFAVVLTTAAPLILTALGAVMVLRAGLFSIGQEGQYGMGAIAAVFVGFAVPLPPGIHAVVALLAGALVGAALGSLPAIFRIFFGANELIVSIILNSVAMLVLSFLVNYPLRDSGGTASYTPIVDESARLMAFDPGTKLGMNLVIALAMVVLVWLYMAKTPWGYEQRMAGDAPIFARYTGLRTRIAVIRAASLGGALAGLGGGVQALGMNYRVIDGFMDGTGFNGLTAAILGGTTVVGGSLAAILFAGITVGAVNGLQILLGVPREIGSALLALMILFVSIQGPVLRRLELWLAKRRGIAAIRASGGSSADPDPAPDPDDDGTPRNDRVGADSKAG
ncbi:MAG: ABC transporter permease [Naasia sp.]